MVRPILPSALRGAKLRIGLGWARRRQRAFVEASVAFQTGKDSRFSISRDALEQAIVRSAKVSLHWNARTVKATASGTTSDAEDAASLRNIAALRTVLDAGCDFDVLIDMRDCRKRAVADRGSTPAPVFSFVRLQDGTPGRILWPLGDLHDIGSDKFLGGLDPSRVPWREKDDLVLWRGGPTNRSTLGGAARGLTRHSVVLRRYRKGVISEDTARQALMSMPRFRLMHLCFDNPRFDVGFTGTKRTPIDNEPLLLPYARPRMAREEFQKSRYILVVPGNDVASSFYWTLNSGSLALVVDCSYVTFGNVHFRPWEHFVPVKADLSDLDAVLRWCDDHQDDCAAMAARAAEQCRFLGDPDLRAEVNRGVIDAVRRAIVPAT